MELLLPGCLPDGGGRPQQIHWASSSTALYFPLGMPSTTFILAFDVIIAFHVVLVLVLLVLLVRFLNRFARLMTLYTVICMFQKVFFAARRIVVGGRPTMSSFKKYQFIGL
jgi:hypothetical protein